MENISGKISKSLITCYVNLGMENQKKKKFNPGGTPWHFPAISADYT